MLLLLGFFHELSAKMIRKMLSIFTTILVKMLLKNFTGLDVKLQTEHLGNPRPDWIIKIMRWNHPPLGERIDFCNEYRPWKTGEPLEYEGYFHTGSE